MDGAGRKRFGATVRHLRVAKGLTQEDLAEAASLHPSYVGGVERGQRNISLDNILKLARALKVHPSALFTSSVK